MTVWTPGTVPLPARRLVTRCEGLSLPPYQDIGGVWTIGLGDTLDLSGDPVTADTPTLTPDQADALCTRALATAAADVARLVHVDLTESQASALIDWTYNMGGGWHVARSTLLVDLNAGRPATVPAHLREWVFAAGRPLLGLLRRRWAEAAVWCGMDADAACDAGWREIMALGQWPGLPMIAS